jgi:hypothetical protein
MFGNQSLEYNKNLRDNLQQKVSWPAQSTTVYFRYVCEVSLVDVIVMESFVSK